MGQVDADLVEPGVLPRIALANPKLRLEVHATDRFVDLIQEGSDIALRSHAAPLADSVLTQRRLAEAPVVAVAAPAYLAAQGHPHEPSDLAGHAGLLSGPQATVWRFRHEDGREVPAEPGPVMVPDESTMLIEAAAAGLGIACLPADIVAPAVAEGRLVRLLPSWHAGTITATILMPPRRSQLPGVRAVVEFLCRPG